MDFVKRVLDIFSAPENPKEKAKSSAKKARERLQIILAHDRTDISPDLLNILRNEMINVLKKYMEINETGIEIETGAATESGGMAIAVNIPVLQIKRGSHLIKEI